MAGATVSQAVGRGLEPGLASREFLRISVQNLQVNLMYEIPNLQWTRVVTAQAICHCEITSMPSSTYVGWMMNLYSLFFCIVPTATQKI